MGISMSQQNLQGGYDHWYIPVSHKPLAPGMPVENIDELPNDIFFHLRKRKLVFHNAKFDIHVLNRAGVPVVIDGVLPDVVDTMLMHHYINENDRHDLDSLTGKYTKVRKNTDLAKKLKPIWETSPIPYMAQYASEDAVATVQLYEALAPEFNEHYLDTWEKVDRDFLFCLLDIEKKGLPIDRDQCLQRELECRIRMDEIKNEVGWDIGSSNLLQERLFGEPPVGYGLAPISRTQKGKPQVNEAFLKATNHPVCGLILEYRKLQKMASSYFQNYYNISGEASRLHPTFKMHGTVTGRLSCEYPNLQQIPRDSIVKKMFLAEEGKQLWEIDYRTLEARMAAVYTKSPALLEIFREGRDIHQEVADRLGISRQVAKIVNFLILYGGREEALAFQAGITYREAKRIIVDYEKAYPEVFKFMSQCEYISQRQGYIRMFSGRRRHFKYESETRKAFNAIIQGGSFELVKRSMISMWKGGVDMRNQVHDSVWLMVDNKKEVEEAERLMVEWTEGAFGLEFPVESKQLN